MRNTNHQNIVPINEKSYVKLEKNTVNLENEGTLPGKDDSNSVSLDPLTCGLCNKKYAYKRSLKAHIQEVHEGVRFTCDKCEQQYATQASLQRHICFIYDGASFACKQCDRKFTDKRNLGRHIRSAHKGRKFTCNQCKKEFTDQGNLKRHIQNAHEGVRKFVCNHCDKNFTSQHNLNCHMLSVHDGIRFACDLCDKQFTNKAYLKMHIQSAHKRAKFVCNVCGKFLSSSSALKIHNRAVHEKQQLPRNHICHKCDHKCVTMSQLKRHLESHRRKKLCPHCGIKVRKLILHIQTVHTPDEKKKHQCQDCGKGFLYAELLKKHEMNVHLKLRPYKCRYGCDTAYNDKGYRNRHEKRIHGKVFTVVRDKNKQEII